MHILPKSTLALTALAVLGMAAAPTHAQTLTFDDVTPDGPFLLIPNGYHGLDWNNFFLANGADTTTYSGGAGFANGVVSGTNEAFTGFSSPASLQSATAFDLTSGYFTAGFSNQTATIVGLDSLGNPIAGDSKTFDIVTSGPVLETFNYVGIYGVAFNPSSDHIVVDNLVLNSAPVPEASSTVSLGLLLALGGMVVAARHKKANLPL